jgi:uncharacterized membrane protein
VSRLTGYSQSLLSAVVLVLLAAGGTALALQGILTDPTTARSLVSSASWPGLVATVGGAIYQDVSGQHFAVVPLARLFVWSLVWLTIWTTAAATVKYLRRRSHDRLETSALSPGTWREWTIRLFIQSTRWWLLPGIWELLRILLLIAGDGAAGAVLGLQGHYVLGLAMAGSVTELFNSRQASADLVATDSTSGSWRVSKAVLAGILVYVVVFVAMNWQLYECLQVPHGDSAMYEEHLWNLLHGKGFRSYLDQGLFLGEHVQVVHVLLVPFYALWPSHLLLELCESIALASGAVPVFWMARRWSGSNRSASLLALSYLLYPPLQFIDIAIDLKTFRPIAFGIPAMLFALDQLERGRIKTTILLFALALSSKEDYAQILGPLGLWIAGTRWWQQGNRQATQSPDGRTLDDDPSVTSRYAQLNPEKTQTVAFGLSLAVGAVLYLLVVTRVVILWFRDGEELHYVRYFAKFGDSPVEILSNMLLNPSLLFGELVTAQTLVFLLALLVPLVCLPLLSPTRFLVAVPAIVLLCLNSLVQGDPHPWHHFHAPVIPILFWAAAGGLQHLRSDTVVDSGPFLAIRSRLRGGLEWSTTLVALSCLLTGGFTSIHPAGIAFWDPGALHYWRSLYVAGPRVTHLHTSRTFV